MTQEAMPVIGDYEGKFHCVLIFGPPGAGKGTVSRIISQAGKLYHLSTGDIFRGLAPETPAGKLCSSYSDQGLLVPDAVTIRIWNYFMNGLIATNRFQPESQLLLLDGIPRTLPQAELIAPYIDVRAIIRLNVEDEDELVRRLRGRATQEGRIDDANEEVLRKRLDVYHRQTAEVVDYYPKSLVIEINGQQPPLHVLGEVFTKCADALSFEKASSPKV